MISAWDSVFSLAWKTGVLCSALFVKALIFFSVVMVRVENIDPFLHHLEVGEEDHVHDA